MPLPRRRRPLFLQRRRNRKRPFPPRSPAANANDTALQSGVIAGFPAKDAAEASIVRERDWKKGAEEPAVTIIEYGDFQ